MEFEFFIGIDVSKDELDFSVQQGKCFLFHQELSNEPGSIKAFIKELKKLKGFEMGKTVFCMEHTGIYNNHALSCLYGKKGNICLEAASQIKNSMGNIRGKNDKVDSIRIAEYAYRNRESLRLWEPKREVVSQLANYSAIRSRLLTAQKMLKTPLKELSGFTKKKIAKQNQALCNTAIKAIKGDLAKVDQAIALLISGDAELKRLFAIVTSVCGIGKVTGVQLLITTNEFKDIDQAKQYACYAGVAPFTDESGKVKKKARVSHMANKKVKTLLHLAAMVAIQYNPDLKAFYERKIGEGKNKMSVINAVRNKLILRIFACVNQNRQYEKNYCRLVA